MEAEEKIRTSAVTGIALGLLVASGLMLYARTLTAREGGVGWPKVFASIERDWPQVPQMDSGELARRLKAREEHRPFLIDVRSNLKGSIFKWANEGRPLVQDGKPTHQVHPYNKYWGRLLDQSYHPK